MTTIVADVGVNHGGSFKTAKQLVNIAKDVGIDAVKFQCFWCFPELEELELTKAEYSELFAHCNYIGMKWFATPFDYEAVQLLKHWKMGTWKLPSNETVLKNSRLLKDISKARRRLTIISTGKSTDRQIGRLLKRFTKNTMLLHCVSKYPTPLSEINLKRIPYLKKKFNVPVGYSDHSGWSCPITWAALDYGAPVVEAHITLDHNADGPDHKASLVPRQWEGAVRVIKGDRNEF